MRTGRRARLSAAHCLHFFSLSIDHTTREMWAQMVCLHPSRAASGLYGTAAKSARGDRIQQQQPQPFHAWHRITPDGLDYIVTIPVPGV